MATGHPEKPPSTTPAGALGPMTSAELRDRPLPVLLVPVGSCEQHGPHLPLDTDTRIAVAVCHAVAAGRGDAVVAPALAYGSSGEHQAFPGTLSIGTEALRTVLVELGRSAFPAPGRATPTYAALVLVNGHGGNLGAVRDAASVLAAEGRPVSAWWPTIPDGDAHAGRTETSLLLAICPDVVGPERPIGTTTALAELLPELRAGGTEAVAPDGVLGDATGASAEEGRRLLASLADDLAGRISASRAHLPGSRDIDSF